MRVLTVHPAARNVFGDQSAQQGLGASAAVVSGVELGDFQALAVPVVA